jgi:integrase
MLLKLKGKGADDKIRALKPDPGRPGEPAKRLEHRIDCVDLGYVIVQPSGLKSFAVRARINGRTVKLDAGRFDPNYTGIDQFDDAKERMDKLTREVRAGRDPRVAQRATKEKARADRGDTVAAAFEAELERRRDRGDMRTLGQWEAKGRRYLLADKIFATLPMSQVQRSDITDFLDRVRRRARNPKGKGARSSGQRTAEMVYSILAVLIREHQRTHDDYVTPLFRGLFETKQRRRKHLLSDPEIKMIWLTAAESGAYGAGVQLALGTGARRREVFGMTWDEIRGGVWALPPERNKVEDDGSGGELLRPLSELMQGVLRGRKRIHDYPLVVKGRPITKSLSTHKRNFDARLAKKFPGAVVRPWMFHDLRRAARTLMTRCGVDRRVAEICLGHAQPDGYDCHDYQPEMQRAYEVLAAEIERILGTEAPVADGKVAQLAVQQ